MKHEETKNRKNKNILAVLLLLLAFIIILGASVAFFSDFVIGGIAGTTSTLDLTLETPIQVARYYTVAGIEQFDNPGAVITNLNPGDIIQISYGITNEGNTSAWFRNIVNLNIGANYAGEQPETAGMFRLYELTESRAAIREGTATAIAISTASGFEFTSQSGILNGSGDGAELEVGGVNGEQSVGYLLSFSAEAGNEFQRAQISYEITTQAMQFRNNPNPDWNNIVSTEFRLGY